MTRGAFKILSRTVRANVMVGECRVYGDMMLRRHPFNGNVQAHRLATKYLPGRDTERLVNVWPGLAKDIRRTDIAIIRTSGRVPLPR